MDLANQKKTSFSKIWLDFQDPVCHFETLYFKRCGIAGGERLPPALLEYFFGQKIYFDPKFLQKKSAN